MIRAIISTFLGFVLIFIEGFIVIKVNNYTAIDFGSIQLFMMFWAINTCVIYSIFNDVGRWLENKPQLNLLSTRK